MLPNRLTQSQLDKIHTKYVTYYSIGGDVVYIILCREKYTIACVQWFDMFDYDENKIMKTAEDEEIIYFDTEQDAITTLNELFLPEFIEERYRTFTNTDVFK